MDLIEFLRARLDEDEQTARATMWEGSGNRADWSLPASATVDTGKDEFYAGDRTLAAHIARHDPARVLREVEAKRRMLEDVPGSEAWETAVVLLALPYTDHPDYRPEWRP